MTEMDDRSWQYEVLPILGETLLCAAAMALPFLLLGGALAGIVSAGIALFWHRIFKQTRRRFAGETPEAEPKDEETAPRFLFAAQLSVLSIVAFAYVVTTRFLYAPASIPEELKSILRPGFEIPAILFLLAGGLLSYNLYRTRQSDVPSGPSMPDIREALLLWFGAVAVFLAMTVVIGPPIAFYQIAEMTNLDRTPAAWEIFSDFPPLTPAILLVAVFSVIPGDERAGKRRQRLGKIIRTAGFPVAMILSFYGCVHLAALAATTSVPAFISVTLAGTEAFNWTAEQQDKGVPPAEIAVLLNEYGQPVSLTAADGLAILLPDYRDKLMDWGTRADCTVVLSAGVADSAELADMAWPEDLKSYRDPEAPREILDVKYCLKVTCPSAVAGDGRSMYAMYSSHPARNAGWLHALRFHLFDPDEKLNAGGYCNADGSLADTYQG